MASFHIFGAKISSDKIIIDRPNDVGLLDWASLKAFWQGW